jgi:hypothetical protein
MADCPTSGQSGTGSKKINDTRTDPVPYLAVWHFFGSDTGQKLWMLNTNAGISFLDAVAQL